MYNFFSEPENVICFLKVFIAISLFVSNIQNIINRNHFSKGRLLDWEILKKKRNKSLFRKPFFDHAFDKNGFILLNTARIVLLPFFVLNTALFPVIVICLTGLSFLIYTRMDSMCNAADQVNNVVLTGLTIHLFFETINSTDYLIYFFFALLVISYFTSGLSKFYEKHWHTGVFLKAILLNRNSYSSLRSGVIKSTDQGIFRLSSQTVIAWQLLSFTTPFLPPTVLYLYLFIGLTFHIITGVFLGLHNFIWTFTALLPCVIFVNSRVYHQL